MKSKRVRSGTLVASKGLEFYGHIDEYGKVESAGIQYT